MHSQIALVVMQAQIPVAVVAVEVIIIQTMTAATAAQASW
jgi:hypothetical protein